jgi:ribosomal protein S18 acetylase RimI-like enzyme
MTVTVRPVHTSELAEVGDLTAAAYAADGYLVEDDPYATALRDVATRAREAEVYVAELADPPGGIAGTVTFCPEGSPWCEVAGAGEGEFRMLAVDPAARRRGVAAALVGLCVERSRELGYTAVVLSSLPMQRPAHRLYERLGFRRTPELDWSPQEGIDLIAFRLDLPR